MRTFMTTVKERLAVAESFGEKITDLEIAVQTSFEAAIATHKELEMCMDAMISRLEQ